MEDNNRTLKDILPPWPWHEEDEKQALLRVLNSGSWWRGAGDENTAFEEEFSKFLGMQHVRLTSSGSGALEIALQLGDIGPGDHVLVPACTFIATASAVLRMGAVPIPVDVNANDLCIDVADLRNKLTDKSKCVIPVHMAGHGVNMNAIGDIAKENNLFVIEDAAHAHGAKWKGQTLGSFGDVSIFSFQNGKLMTSGEGGAVATNNAELVKRTFALHSCGRPEGDTLYEHLEIAGNWRQSEFNAAILRSQLRRLPEQIKIREDRVARFDARCHSIDGVTCMRRDNRATVHSHYMAMYWIDDAVLRGRVVNDIAVRLRTRGIFASKFFPPVHHTAMFAKKNLKMANRSDGVFPDYSEFNTPVSVRASSNVIWFHHSLFLADEPTVDLIADAFAEELHSEI